jgi:hypothetical protein
VAQRVLIFGVTGSGEICNGNTESIRQVFSRKSVIIWHFQSFARKRRQMREWQRDPGKPETVRLTSPAATRRWLTAQPARSATAAGPDRG